MAACGPRACGNPTRWRSESCTAGVEYLVVGAYALAAHGTPRATGRPKDLADIADIAWIEGQD